MSGTDRLTPRGWIWLPERIGDLVLLPIEGMMVKPLDGDHSLIYYSRSAMTSFEVAASGSTIASMIAAQVGEVGAA